MIFVTSKSVFGQVQLLKTTLFHGSCMHASELYQRFINLLSDFFMVISEKKLISGFSSSKWLTQPFQHG